MTEDPETLITTDPDEDYEHTILIVDDNPTNLGVLSNYLNTFGFRILVARNGESALQRAAYTQPDIILLDVLMPGMDGFQTCAKLKSNRSTKDIPVIFMTALADASDKVKGFNAGGVDYITKPLQFEEVLARVNTHLSIRDLTQNLQDQANMLQQFNTTLVKQNVQLEASSELGRQVTSILDLDELLARVVELIQSKFNYHFVGIWLLEEQQGAVVLQARAGAEGIPLPQLGFRLSIDQEEYAIVWVGRTCEYHLAGNLSRADKMLAVDNLPGARSELALPLQIGQESIGVLDILSDEVGAFTPEDIIVLQTLADQIAVAIRNAEFYKVEQRRRRLAESLEHTGRVLSLSLDMRQVPSRILEELSKVVPFERGSVLLQQGNELYSITQHGYPENKQSDVLQIPLDSGDIYQRLTESRRPLLIDDVTQDQGWRQLDWLPVHHSWLGVPLISRGKVIGMISLTRRKVGSFSLDDATMVLAFAGQAAIALENARLYDEITRLNEDLEQKVIQRTAELNKAYQILEKLDKTKNDFINVTSHELRTPLSVIKGYTQILGILPTVSQDAKAAELLTGINTGVNRMHQIVNTTLDVARIDAELLQLQPELVELHAIVQEVSDTFSEALEERQLTLTSIDLDALPSIEADPDLLYKVFYNLVVNAIKYTPDKGRIIVRGCAPDKASSGASPEDSFVKIIVSDTGIGINPEHHEQIFEKFYQTGEVSLHSSGHTKFKGGGPGLGLAIVRGIVLAHNGKVWVESEKHDEETYPGSDFHVLLPLRINHS